MNTINRARNILSTSIDAVNGSTSDYDFSELKQLMSFLVNEMESLETDIALELEGGEVRIICEDSIDSVMQESMESDLYVLGCYDTGSVVDATGLPAEMIEACKESEAFEAIGKGIIATNGLEALQEAASAADGYGHYFSGYDGVEHNAERFYIFRTN